jgi:hypothetical protein
MSGSLWYQTMAYPSNTLAYYPKASITIHDNSKIKAINILDNVLTSPGGHNLMGRSLWY